MASLSFSSASIYQDCPKKYQYQYILKGRPSIKFNNRVFIEGDVVHKCLEQGFLTKKPLDKEKVLASFEKNWAISYAHQLKQGSFILFKNETLEGLKEKTKVILGQAIDYIKSQKLDEGNYWNEYSIGEWHTPYDLGDGLRVHGKADQVMDHGDFLAVFDFKTSKDDKYLKAAQIILYIIVIEKKLKKPVKEAAFLMFRNNEKIDVRITEEDKEKVLSDLKTISKSIDSGKFVPTPSEKVCGDCIFRMDCKDSLAKNKDSEKNEKTLQDKPKVFTLGEL